ncbi:MAG: D-alanine--D-alanine ligase family protein [Actinomycetota bacterium]
MASAPGPRPRLVVLFGGRSAEHDVSCVSARHVLAAVDPARYDIEPVGITRDGQWVLAEAAMKALADGADGLPARLTADGPEVDALPMLSGPTPSDGPTVVLPILHGPMGEDGTVQGLLELAGVPYVGAGVLASALCMDKVAAKNHLAAHGLPQGAYRWMTVDDDAHGGVRRPDGSSSSVAAEVDAAIDQLGLPLFIKPANMGSSIGVSRATDRDAAIAAVELAASYDRLVVIEEAIDGREIELAVLGNEDPEASVAGEIVPGADFYDYDDKYDDGADLLIPAPLDPDELATAQRLAVAAFRALHVEGLARVDFFYEADGRGWLINELNTMPGFTPISQYPKLWAASGLDYPALIDRLVELAIARHERSQGHTRTDR